MVRPERQLRLRRRQPDGGDRTAQRRGFQLQLRPRRPAAGAPARAGGRAALVFQLQLRRRRQPGAGRRDHELARRSADGGAGALCAADPGAGDAPLPARGADGPDRAGAPLRCRLGAGGLRTDYAADANRDPDAHSDAGACRGRGGHRRGERAAR